jgi:hypothetical protein
MDIGPFIWNFGEWLKEWMSVLADAVTVVALIGAFFGWRSFAARRLEAEKAIDEAREERENWWRRVQWAIDLSTSDDHARQQVGFSALTQLARSELTTVEDLELMEALTGVYLRAAKPVETKSPRDTAPAAPEREANEREG